MTPAVPSRGVTVVVVTATSAAGTNAIIIARNARNGSRAASMGRVVAALLLE